MEMLGIGTAYSALKDLVKWLLQRNKRLSPNEVLKRRAEWKPKFEDILSERKANDLGHDVIIRDISRLDEYPEFAEDGLLRRFRRRRISSWFKAGLIGTYESGIYLGLQWDRLIEEDGIWRQANFGEGGGETLILTGRIPYEAIEHVDWRGDDFYSNGQIYCLFQYRGEPYRDVGYYRLTKTDFGHFLTKVVDYKLVAKRKLTRRPIKAPGE